MEELRNVIIKPLMKGSSIIERNPLVLLILEGSDGAEQLVLGEFEEMRGSRQEPKIKLENSIVFKRPDQTHYSDCQDHYSLPRVTDSPENGEYSSLWSFAYTGSKKIIKELKKREDWTSPYAGLIKR
ncbi:hypothetical protein K8R30_03085 [archaeon]|nr:hypothetical protein [archaeon]